MAGSDKTLGLTMLGRPACDPKGQLKLYPPLSGSKVSFSSDGVAFELKVTCMLIHQNSEILSSSRQGQL